VSDVGDSLEQRRNARLTAGDSKIIKTTVDINISGTRIRYAVTDGRGGKTVIGPKDNRTTDVNITATAPDRSVFKVYLDPADTEDLLGRYHHEAELEDADGDITTVFAGLFIVRPDSI
jgi:hypothetical protein